MENILSGSRKYNLGLTLSHQEFRQLQSRSQDVASSVLSNCYTRICFRLGDTDAEKFAGGFSFFDSKALQNLGIGEAIGRIEKAEHDFNLNVSPALKIDRQAAEKRKTDVVLSTRSRYAKRREDIEAELLIDRNAKAETAEDHMSDETPAADPSKMQKSKRTKEPIGDGNKQHQYLQSLIKRIGESHGFVATVEKQVFGGIGKVDVALENKQYRIACEIAVTNTIDYELQNIQKCVAAGFDRVVVISPDAKHLNNIRAGLDSLPDLGEVTKVHFLEPENFHLFLDALPDTDSPHTESETSKVRGYEIKTSFGQTSEPERRTKQRVILDILSSSLRRKGKKKDE